MMFVVSAIVIGVFVATITLQDANAASNDDSSCRQHHTSDNSKKCSKNTYDSSFSLEYCMRVPQLGGEAIDSVLL